MCNSAKKPEPEKNVERISEEKPEKKVEKCCSEKTCQPPTRAPIPQQAQSVRRQPER